MNNWAYVQQTPAPPAVRLHVSQEKRARRKQEGVGSNERLDCSINMTESSQLELWHIVWWDVLPLWGGVIMSPTQSQWKENHTFMSVEPGNNGLCEGVFFIFYILSTVFFYQYLSTSSWGTFISYKDILTFPLTFTVPGIMTSKPQTFFAKVISNDRFQNLCFCIFLYVYFVGSFKSKKP